jgi:hypothetical protein
MSVHSISDHWTTNESLLQSYRSIFIASQSLFISGAALTVNTWINLIIVGTAIFHLWIGYTIVNTRTKIVDFYKYDLSRFITNIDDYIHDKDKRLNANRSAGIKTNWRKTRIKIDIYIPLSFLIIWLSFLMKFLLTC